MCTLYENLLSLCAEKGITGGKMCTDIGISKSLMTGLKKGRRSGISTETAQKIADYFGVSVDRVLGKESQTYYVGGPASFRSGLISDSVVIPDQKEKSPALESAELNPVGIKKFLHTLSDAELIQVMSDIAEIMGQRNK